MHVADFEARALTRQTAGSKRRHAAFVRQFRQRIRLVHVLRKLVRPEKCIDNARDRSRVYQVGGREGFLVADIHPFADGAAHS